MAGQHFSERELALPPCALASVGDFRAKSRIERVWGKPRDGAEKEAKAERVGSGRIESLDLAGRERASV